MSSYVVETRRYFHKNPELSFKEFKTADRIESELRSFGLEPVRIADTGCYADIKGTSKGKTVAFRADIDALPVEEKNNIPHKSLNHGVMHACGHDAHVAMALGVARYFSENRNFSGVVRVFFQPAEEAPPGGAVKMIHDHLLDGVDYVFGQHVTSELETGSMGYRPGAANANADSFFVTIKGKGGHGSAPHRSIDAIYLASQYIMLIQGIVSRKVDPVRAAVVTVGTIKGGYRHNIIADEVEISGTVRTQDTGTQKLIREELETILVNLCKMAGATYEYSYEEGYPVMINDPNCTEKVSRISSEMLGNRNVHLMDQKMGGEDFGYYLKNVPGTFYYLGVANGKKGIVSPNHSPTFDVDEDALDRGTELAVEIIRAFLH